jgi:hypothetical protein
MDLREIGREGVDCIHWLRILVVGRCEHANETSGCIKGGEFLDWLETSSFSRRIQLHGVRLG